MEALRIRVQCSLFSLSFFFLPSKIKENGASLNLVPDDKKHPLLTSDGYAPGGRRIPL